MHEGTLLHGINFSRGVTFARVEKNIFFTNLNQLLVFI